MADTKIEWADAVWNPVTGCSKVSAGCSHCYAEGIARRFWGSRKFTDVQCHCERLDQPLHWRKPRRVFVNSMSDLFHEGVPFEFVRAVISRMFPMAYTNYANHTFMILTKRPQRMKEFFDWLTSASDFTIEWPLRNVWLGVTAENQEMADKRIPILLQIPAAVRFVSVEPMLGPVDLSRWLDPTGIRCQDVCKDAKYILPDEVEYNDLGEPYCPNCGLLADFTGYDPGIDWVICGGESGHKARPMHPDWVRSLRDQCQAAGVPFFFKQWGEWSPENQTPEDVILPGKHRYHEFKDGLEVGRYGKKLCGRLLDGREWNEFPVIKR